MSSDRGQHKIRVFSSGVVMTKQRIQTVSTSGAPRPIIVPWCEIQTRLFGRVSMRLFDVALYVVILVTARTRPTALVVPLPI